MVQTVTYGANNNAAWSAPSLAGEGVGKGAGKGSGEGRDEGVDSVHTPVHLLHTVRLQ